MTHQLEGPTYWTPASTAQKRSSNYDQQETVGNTTNLATKVVNVMKELNVGPTASGISVIKDAILTVYSQPTLGAHLPGNGMGGSTKPTAIINPAISTGVTACGVNQIGKAVADCSKSSGCTPQEAGAPKSESDFELPLCCNIAANQWSNYKDANVRPKVLNMEAGAGLGYVEWNQVAAVAEAQAAAKNNLGVAPKSSDNNGKNLRKTKNNNAGLTYPSSAQYAVNPDGTVKQPTSGCTNLRANALGVGNSLATTEWAQFPVAASAAELTCTVVYTGGATLSSDTASGQANGAGAISDGSEAKSNLNCVGPSVGFLTPYYIGGKWASEPAVVTGANAWIYNNFAQTAEKGAAKGKKGNPFDNPVTFQATVEQVQSVGPNPNTIATNNSPFGAAGAWGTAGKFKGARQNFAYLSADITMKTAVVSGNTKNLYARLATADHQFAPIRAGDSGNDMGGETSKACVTGADGGNTAKTSNSE